jgi:hypothetical protein
MKAERNWKRICEERSCGPDRRSFIRFARSSAETAEPVSEDRLRIGLVHAGDGEVQLLSGGETDAILVDRADFSDCDLHAGVGVAGAIKLQSSTAEHELTGTAAAEGFFMARVVGQRGIGGA